MLKTRMIKATSLAFIKHPLLVKIANTIPDAELVRGRTTLVVRFLYDFSTCTQQQSLLMLL